MSQFFSIHPDNPQLRLIRQAVAIIRDGGVAVLPTDSCYALGCHIGDKAAMERIRGPQHVSEIDKTDESAKQAEPAAPNTGAPAPTAVIAGAEVPGG